MKEEEEINTALFAHILCSHLMLTYFVLTIQIFKQQTLTQPDELYSCPWLKRQAVCGECKDEERPTNEKERTRMNGHRFIIAADTQFGILMDGEQVECTLHILTCHMFIYVLISYKPTH